MSGEGGGSTPVMDRPPVVTQTPEAQGPNEVLKNVGQQFDATNQKFGGKLFLPIGRTFPEGGGANSRLFDSGTIKSGTGTESMLIFDDQVGFRKIVMHPSQEPGSNFYSPETVKHVVNKLRGPRDSFRVIGDTTLGHHENGDGTMEFVLPEGVIAKSGSDKLGYELATKEDVETALRQNVILAKEKEEEEARQKLEAEKTSALGIATEVFSELPSLLQLPPTPLENR